MLKVNCAACGKELDEQGGILLGDATPRGYRKKHHICAAHLRIMLAQEDVKLQSGSDQVTSDPMLISAPTSSDGIRFYRVEQSYYNFLRKNLFAITKRYAAAAEHEPEIETEREPTGLMDRFVRFWRERC